MYEFGVFNLMDDLFPIMFIIIFALIIYTFIKNIQQNAYNKKQPIIPVSVKIVSKRYDVWQHTDNSFENMHNTSSSTNYYATFEMTNGERIEFEIPPKEFGMMAEGDKGTLEFQGTRFISFTR